MIPFVCQSTVPGITEPFAGSIRGAFAGSYADGSKLLSSPFVSVGCGKNDQRTPAYTTSRGLSLKSSCAYISCCHDHTSGVTSIEAWVNVATLPNRKFVHACWNVDVPVGTPRLEKLNEP